MSFRPRSSKRWSLKRLLWASCADQPLVLGFIANYVETQSRRAPSLHTSQPIKSLRRNPSRCLSVTRKLSDTSAAEPGAPEEPPQDPASTATPQAPRRGFHNYFVTHLPSSSLHPDSRISGPHHRLPRSAATRYVPTPGSSPAPAAAPPNVSANRDLTVVRIPLRSAKHHFGVAESRGQRPHNEDTNQAGTIDMPSFAKRTPISLVRSAMNKSGEATPADSAFGDPQIFYFAVFDGHGGDQCSSFLREELHGYIEEAASEFELKSSLKANKKNARESQLVPTPMMRDKDAGGAKQLSNVDLKGPQEVKQEAEIPKADKHGAIKELDNAEAMAGSKPEPAEGNESKALRLQKSLVKEYKDAIGGYFRRFNPPHFGLRREPDTPEPPVTIEAVLTYAFLRADLDFIRAQARKPDPDDPYVSDAAVNNDEILGAPHHAPPSGHRIGGGKRFKGGSTASIALISTPTPAPFWHPAATSTPGETLTTDHHPSSPSEAQRLRRYTASFITDSFGEERIQGLANSRAFGDMGSKRLGVSAEPEITRTEIGQAQYSFIVLMSDGISGTLSDQEIVDIVKEAKTPEEGATNVVNYTNEVTSNGDNSTCLVVRLGGWERRSEGGLGSLGTKEIRDYRRNEALDPRRGRR
ncbi:protein serine/threonine phosphatase 2C [Apiospora hydei]|uniref:Protein serine/threonine phosphatase 2C n=1 Tax=Apiospora hydei TaxID=1337664 RepID=A0ABR1XBS7_9PEZI